MALNIPLPGSMGDAFGKGLGEGQELFKTLIGPKLERERAELEWRQHAENHALRQEQEERLRQELALAMQKHPYELQNLLSQIAQHNATTEKYRYEMDPEAQARALQAMIGSFSGMGGNIGGNPGEGQNNEALGEFIKSKTGFNPYAETKEQKAKREYDEFVKKEEYKANKEKENLTPTVQSEVQQEVFAIQKARPELKHLIEMEPQTLTWLGTTNDEAYEGLTFRLADSLVKAFKYPQTNESIKKMHNSLKIGATEKAGNYKKRLEALDSDLKEREKKGIALLGNKKVSQSSETGQEGSTNVSETTTKSNNGANSIGGTWNPQKKVFE